MDTVADPCGLAQGLCYLCDGHRAVTHIAEARFNL
jgi:hypothetical protein